MKYIFKYHKFYFLIAAFGLIFQSCASLTGFQDGRTLGEGVGEVNISANISQSPFFTDIVESKNNDFIPIILFPNIELGGRYGIASDLDLTLQVNTNFNLDAGLKYQLVGDRISKYALSSGFKIGTFGLISGLWNFQIPLYSSFHPKDNLAFYLSPKYVYQFSTIGTLVGWNYIGGNSGVLFGSKNKIGLDIGFFSVGVSQLPKAKIFTFGVGGKILIGDRKKSKKQKRALEY